MCQKWLDNKCISYRVRRRGFIAYSTSLFLTNLGLPPSDKRKYMEKIQDKTLTASAWIWQFHWVTTTWQSLMVSWDTAGVPWVSGNDALAPNHAWTQSHHLMKSLLEEMLLYKHQLLYDTYYIYIYIYITWYDVLFTGLVYNSLFHIICNFQISNCYIIRSSWSAPFTSNVSPFLICIFSLCHWCLFSNSFRRTCSHVCILKNRCLCSAICFCSYIHLISFFSTWRRLQ